MLALSLTSVTSCSIGEFPGPVATMAAIEPHYPINAVGLDDVVIEIA